MANKKGITIYDIARHLAISPATISRALNDHPKISTATKEKVHILAQKLGYKTKKSTEFLVEESSPSR